MLAAFGTKTPSPTLMMTTFFAAFRFFYLHSLSCCHQLFDQRPEFGPRLYFETYDEFETLFCDRGLADGTIKPLKKNSTVKLRFESATEHAVEDEVPLIVCTLTCCAGKLWSHWACMDVVLVVYH